LSACLETLKLSPESFLNWEKVYWSNWSLKLSDLNNVLQNELASDKPLKQY
jgi:hypothetical protein